MDRTAVAKRVAEARRARGMTQEELAAKADVSPTHISVLERGVKLPNLDTFIAIANALEVSADCLLQDVVSRSEESQSNELTSRIMELPDETRKRLINALKAFLQD
jgi:Predicted transcription factor, homolog of eukaryotic MBF1